MHDLTIIVPAYNEEAALGSFLDELIDFARREDCKLVVVDDGSTDGTGALLAGRADDPVLTVVHNKVNRGYGGAIKAGILSAETRYVITLDADGQHRLEDVRGLYDVLLAEDADMVVGRRVGRVSSSYRRLGKSLIRFIARLLMPLDVEDLNSGMKIYDRQLATSYLKLCPDTMAYSDIIVLVFISRRHRVLERDVNVRARVTGRSTINLKTALDTVMEIVNIVVLFNPMRVFLPIAMLFIIAGLAWGLPIMFRGEGVSVGTLLLLVSGLLFFLLGLLAEQLSLIRRDQVKS